MRLLRLFSLALLSYAAAQDFDAPDVPKEKHNYQVRTALNSHCRSLLISCDSQSDVARLRKIVINR